MTFKSLIGNYINGDPNRPDFTERDLPANRFQLFFSVLKIRFFSLVGLNLLYLIAWIPAIVWTFVNVLAFQLPDRQASPASFIALYFIILCPLIILTGGSNMGIMSVSRNWARDQHADTFGDFRDAFKANAKPGFLLALINALVLMFSGIAILYYFGSAGGNLLLYIPAAFVLVAAILWDLTAMLMPVMLITYEGNFKTHAKNALIIVIAELPRAVLIRLATLAVPLLAAIICLLFPSATLSVLGIASTLYLFLMPAFNKLLIASFANMVCEKYINTQLEDAKTDIGLRPKAVRKK